MPSPRRSIPLDRWPVAHQNAWARARAGFDMFDDRTSAALWSEETWLKVARAYGRWMEYLEVKGTLTKDDDPADLITPESVSGYVSHLRTTVAASTVEIYVHRLGSAIKAIAPERDWSWLRDVAKRLHSFVKPRSKADRLVPAERLYDLGHRLMMQATQTVASQGRKRKLLYRDGLMIAMLAARPLRRANLTRLRIGRHVVKLGGVWTLKVPAIETKGRLSIDAPLPSDLHDPLRHFLRTYRPEFLGAHSHDRLWPSLQGGPLNDGGVYVAIAKRTKAEFGFVVNPHMFRVCAATTIAIADPVNVRAASQLLGHIRAWTTERYYNHAQTIEASRRYQGHLDALRERLCCAI